MADVELTTMCMIQDKKTNRVLVQERLKSWKGIAFPGGHVENGESMIDAAIREVKEETGLDVKDLSLSGIVHWYNKENHTRYLVFYYRTQCWSGRLIEKTSEGKNFWVDFNQLETMSLSEGFAEQLQIYKEDSYTEAFIKCGKKSREQAIFY